MCTALSAYSKSTEIYEHWNSCFVDLPGARDTKEIHCGKSQVPKSFTREKQPRTDQEVVPCSAGVEVQDLAMTPSSRVI